MDNRTVYRDPEKSAFRRREAIREKIDQSIKGEVKLDNLVNQSDHVLFRISNVFPFDLFPDELIIDELKVSIIKHDFLSEEVRSVFIKDISAIVVEVTPLLASLSINDRYPPTESNFLTHSIQINHLWRGEAIRARKLIQGLQICSKEQVDISGLSTAEAVKKLEEVGRARADRLGLI